MSPPRVIVKKDKITVLNEDGRGIVLRFRKFAEPIEKEIRLIPRWRVCASLAFCSFASAASLLTGAYVLGTMMLLMTAFLVWGASR